MPSFDELKNKLKERNQMKETNPYLPKLPDEQEDAVPYDPNAGTLTNIGRFAANNLMKDQGFGNMLPVAGTVKAAAKLAPEAMGALSKLVQDAPELAQLVKSKDVGAIKTALQNQPDLLSKIKGLLGTGTEEIQQTTANYAQKSPKFGSSLDEAKAAVQKLDNDGVGMYSPEMKQALNKLDTAQTQYDRQVAQKANVSGDKAQTRDFINDVNNQKFQQLMEKLRQK